MGQARVIIDGSLLLENLGFPSGTKLLDIKPGSGFNEVELVLSSKSLPELNTGDHTPIIFPVFEIKTITLKPTLIEWGVDNGS